MLITGATGFLGNHLSEMLVDAGANVVALVRDEVPKTSFSSRWRDAISVVRGDVTDQLLLERLLGEYEVTTVFHLAAQTQVEVATFNPVSTFDSNIRGTWAVLEAIRRSPVVSRVVIASSDKAYGRQAVLPYTEDMALRPTAPYDVSKACADFIATSYALAFDVPVAVTRCGNFFGPGDTNWNRLIPGTVRDIVRGRRPVIRSNGDLIRDYLYVCDGAAAYLDLAEAMANDLSLAGESFNFSTESQFTVLEVVALIQQIMGREDLEPVVEDRVSLEIPHQHLSAKKARDRLGWLPRWGVEDALRSTIDWYWQHLASDP